MAIQYYTMEEAARILGTSADELKHLAKRGELRPFQDRGTLRFRAQEIDELARRRGRGSDSSPELQLGEAGLSARKDPPSSKKKAGAETQSPKKPEGDAGVFDFTLDSDDQVQIGQELGAGGSSASGKKAPSGKGGPTSPPPKPGSDSDVRLVAEGSDLGFQIASDSDVKIAEDSGPASSITKGPGSGKKKAGDQPDSDAKPAKSEKGSDSDVKIVPDSRGDSGVGLGSQKPKTGSDSDIRLVGDSGVGSGSGSGKALAQDAQPTEEIDLDAEMQQAEKAAKGQKKKPKTAAKKPPSSGDDATSPFELSSDDISAKDKKEKKDKGTESSSDFDLKPGGDSSIELSSDEIQLQVDDEVGLGELAGTGGESGINLQDPADSGISLEQAESSSDSIEFELSLDEGGSTPNPDKKKAAAAAPSSEADSDSEFELTLDDSGGLAPIEEEQEGAGGEKDIFETDFEVPALDEESGSQAVALEDSDTDLESSDFDLALGDEDASSDEESGSQVVALEDEEADDAAETVTRPSRGGAAVAEEEVEELIGEEEAVGVGRAPAVAAAPADWGKLPAIALIPCTIVMFLVTFMGFELVRGMWGYRQSGKVSGLVVDPVARMFTDDLPKD